MNLCLLYDIFVLDIQAFTLIYYLYTSSFLDEVERENNWKINKPLISSRDHHNWFIKCSNYG